MPRNGTGQYSLPTGINPVVPGTTIASAWANTTLQDLALAITNSIAKDGQTAMTGSLNMGGNRIRDVADPVDPTDAVSLGFISEQVLTQGGVSGWNRPESGVFPQMEQTAPTKIQVPSGTGFIIHPTNGKTEVEWDAEEITLEHITTDWVTTVAVNTGGNIVQLAGNIDQEWARSYVILGTVVHINNAIDSVNNTPVIYNDVPYAMYDLAMVLRNTTISGGILSGSAIGGLSLDLSARTVFFLGGDANDVDAPNFVSNPANDGVEFFPITGQSTVSAITGTVPVGFYDPDGGGTVTAIPGSNDVSTIFRLFQIGNSFVLLYGQTLYDTLAEAVAAFSTESYVVPDKLQNATYIGAVIARKGAENLNDPNDAVISTGASGGGSSSTGGSTPMVVQFITANTLVEGGNNELLLISTSATPITVTLKKTSGTNDFVAGNTVSVLQWGTGSVSVVIEDDAGEIKPPELFENSVRAQGCTATFLCTYPDANQWSSSGDLAPSDVGGDGWTDATLLGNWVDVVGYGPVRYRKDALGLVTIEGMCQNGEDGPIFALPEGFRPENNLVFCGYSAGGAYRIDVKADGSVDGTATNELFISLAGVQFYAVG